MNKITPTFERTVNVLVEAFLKETLEHSNCFACAVGNLIADACGYTLIKNNEYPGLCKFIWDDHIQSDWADQVFYITRHSYQTLATGYSLKELHEIEKAFELNNRPASSEGKKISFTDTEWVFNGLMAVVDVLADIHNIDLKEKEEAKVLFHLS